MSAISTWSKTAANNNLTPPDGWPENQAPSTVNDSAREMMAALRTQFEGAEWFDDGLTKTFVSTTQFRIDGQDVTSAYHVGRRVRFVGATPGTIYGSITVTAFVTDTTVTVAWDSGVLANETITGSYSILSGVNNALPSTIAFAPGTIMLFQQTAAPIGWTKETTHDNKALRVVTGAASSAGTNSFTTVLGGSAGISTDGYTLLIADIPGHAHAAGSLAVSRQTTGGGSTPGMVSEASAILTDQAVAGSTASAGGDGSHAHTLSLDIQYVDLILAAKD